VEEELKGLEAETPLVSEWLKRSLYS
jgi:hypothetical protein